MTKIQQSTADRIAFQHAEPIADPEFHLEVLAKLHYDADVDGGVPLASDPDNRYPYAYPRDIASITRAWLTAIRHDVRPAVCLEHILESARFMIDVEDDGRWYQRYALDGTDHGIYQQEDNVAHGVRILAHAILALDACDTLGEEDNAFLSAAVEAIDAAVSHARTDLYDANAHLIESTTSIHEGAIESGYTLWVNCAFIAAFRQALDALDRIDERTSLRIDAERDRLVAFLDHLEPGVQRSFAVDGVPTPRRFTPDGKRDDRPDITLLAPAYFDLEDLFGEHATQATERAAAGLEDPQLGGLQRFRGFHRDHDVHQHGGSGPWMQYTAWHAQFRYDRDEKSAGDDVLSSIVSHVDEDGLIPEHLSTRERFEQFRANEWDTGVDFKKEFDADVLRDIPFNRVVEELESMREAYDGMAKALESNEVIAFAAPLAWCHAEFLTALLKRSSH